MEAKEKLNSLLDSVTRYAESGQGRLAYKSLDDARTFAYSNNILTPTVENALEEYGRDIIKKKLGYAQLSAEKALPLNIDIAIDEIRSLAESHNIILTPSLENELEEIQHAGYMNAIETRLTAAYASALNGEKFHMDAALNIVKKCAKELGLDLTEQISRIENSLRD